MRKVIFLASIAAFIALMLGTGGELHAQRVFEVRIASPLPQQSPWGRTLDRIASEWARVTNGQVRMRVLHGGTEGGEGRMHQSLASNVNQAAVFTSLGLSTIDPSIITLSAPFLIRNEAELAVVMREVQGDLETRLNSGDYFIVAWSQAGFVNVFSRDPVFTPDDLKRMRIASGEETADMNTVFRHMGFQVQESDWGEIGTRLVQGQIAAIYNNPAAVAAFQLHTQTPIRNMLSTNIAPVLGGIVINQVTWRRIGSMNPRFQQELVRVTRQIAEELDRSMQGTVNNAIASMGREGLTVNRPSPDQEQLWFDEMARALPSLIGSSLDMNLYNRINDILTRYRGSR